MLALSVSADSVPIAYIRSVVKGIEVGHVQGVELVEGVTNLSSWISDDKTWISVEGGFCELRRRPWRMPKMRFGCPSSLA